MGPETAAIVGGVGRAYDALAEAHGWRVHSLARSEVGRRRRFVMGASRGWLAALVLGSCCFRMTLP